MFDDFKVANYQQALVSPELFARPLARIFSGDVMDGLTVTPGTGLQAVLAPGNTLIRYGSAGVASARIVSLVSNFNLTIPTADASNPRLDLVVIYVDNSVSLPPVAPGAVPSADNLDGKGVAKAIIVKGTAAATPAAPNPTAIQAAVGAGNPYTVVASVRVNAGVSTIAANLITDLRNFVKVGSKNIDSATLTTVDANGYTVTQQGKELVATKRFTFNLPAMTNGTAITCLSGINKPVGVPADAKYQWSVHHNGGNGAELFYGHSQARDALYARASGGNIAANTGSSLSVEYRWTPA